jgi:deazaflavin-dependent oxidoreductase (nitroreductase family)
MDVREMNQMVIEQFRAGHPVEGLDRRRLLLLTTTGRQTGQPRTTPLMFARDGDDLIVAASAMGAPAHPDWYLNLVTSPGVTVELDGDRFEAAAVTATGARREQAWAVLQEQYPFVDEHAARAGREIPAVVLTRSAA